MTPETPVPLTDAESVLVSQEQLEVGMRREESGRVRAVKHVDTEHVTQDVSRGIEQADVDRTPAAEGDSGQVETLPDGSLSIPVFEEQIVVEKRMVVRERIIVRKHTVYEDQQISADLRRERVELITEGDITVVDEAGLT